MTRKTEHWLISLPLSLDPDGRNLHAYLMTPNRHDLERACERMMQVAEEMIGDRLLIPMFVSTGPLDAKYRKIVRDVISGMPEVKETMATATDYHFTVFLAPAKTDARLMEIH